MKTRNLTPHKAALAATLLLNITMAIAATPPSTPPAASAAAAEEAVELTGWLHVEDYTMADVVVSYEVNGVAQTATVNENGRLNLTLPANTEVTLRFEKPEHLPKEVVVDTRYVRDGRFGGRTRKVSFAVIMELERRMGGLTYQGPVGSLGFEQGGGCVAVEHTQKLVPAKRNVPMVF